MFFGFHCGPAGGGVVCTRELLWPGGALQVNVDARQGEVEFFLKVADLYMFRAEGS